MKKRLTKIMKNKTRYLIIGCGKFGLGFANRLINEGVNEANIFFVDEDDEVVEKLSNMQFSNVAKSKLNDIAQMDSLFPMNEIDIIVIGSSDFQFSTEIAYSIQNSGFDIKKVYAKASSNMHKKILENFGIEKECIVIPEEEVGSKMALKTFFDSKTEIIDFDSDFSLMNIIVKNEELKGKTIKEISDFWNSKQSDARNWNMVSITDNYNKTFVATSERLIFIDYKVSVFCSKSDRKKIYNFFSKTSTK